MSLPETSPLAASRLRALLGKLRDANLHVPHVAIAGKRSVSVMGCLSLDSPVEHALRYLLRWSDGSEEVLSIEAADGALDLARSNHSGDPCGSRYAVPLFADEQGRATAPSCKARIDPEIASMRDVQRFMRRLLRGVLSAN